MHFFPFSDAVRITAASSKAAPAEQEPEDQEAKISFWLRGGNFVYFPPQWNPNEKISTRRIKSTGAKYVCTVAPSLGSFEESAIFFSGQ